MSNELADLMAQAETDRGTQRLEALLHDPNVMQICANRHDRVFYTDSSGTKAVERLFTPATYRNWVNHLMAQTDVGYTDVALARTPVIEGSFDPEKTDLHGSIHVCTKELTRGDPIVTIRKQPKDIVTLDQMLSQGMMSPQMRLFLEQAVRGNLNIVVSGGSGAGKTTLLKALSWFIPSHERVITVEDIAELHIEDRLPNVAALTTYRVRDEEGRLIREASLVNLAEEALRMRGHRIIVGETRGKEALALTKALTTGHTGWTTVHADSAGSGAWKQLVGYVIEAGVPEHVARDRVANAFHLAVQVDVGRMGRRYIAEITEMETVSEGTEQRRNPLFLFNQETETYEQVGRPTARVLRRLQQHGVNYEQIPY